MNSYGNRAARKPESGTSVNEPGEEHDSAMAVQNIDAADRVYALRNCTLTLLINRTVRALTCGLHSPYSAPMNFDISNLLENWDYQPGQIVVRRFTGRDGQEKIQLRVDLGLLQMNVQGRPDGKRPMGHPSLFEYQEARLKKHMDERGSDDGFVLRAEDCAKLQLEALQFHHRYICLL